MMLKEIQTSRIIDILTMLDAGIRLTWVKFVAYFLLFIPAVSRIPKNGISEIGRQRNVVVRLVLKAVGRTLVLPRLTLARFVDVYHMKSLVVNLILIDLRNRHRSGHRTIVHTVYLRDIVAIWVAHYLLVLLAYPLDLVIVSHPRRLLHLLTTIVDWLILKLINKLFDRLLRSLTPMRPIILLKFTATPIIIATRSKNWLL